MTPIPNRISIAGPGLLGGSLALAIRGQFPGVDLRIWGRRESSAEVLREHGFEGASSDLRTVFDGAELVILATPIGVMEPLARQMTAEARLADGAVVTDVGSVKMCVVEKLTPIFKGSGAIFVGSHPMAGSEKTGFENASADLFRGARCIVTPLPDSPPESVERVARFWTELGTKISRMDPAAHDHVVARISHLPHLAAALIVEVALGRDQSIFEQCGPGFRDTTRVAAGDPVLWTEILMTNRAETLAALRDLQGLAGEAIEWLERRDEAGLHGFLQRAAGRRKTGGDES